MTDRPDLSILETAEHLTDLGYTLMAIGAKKRPLYRGWQNFTPDLARVLDQLKHPRARGLGIVTNGLAVIDFDPPEGLQNYSAMLADPPKKSIEHVNPNMTATTPRGGVHYFYRQDGHPTEPEWVVTNAGGVIAQVANVDVRGTGGYVACPPTAGREWSAGPVAVADLVPAPWWLYGKVDRHGDIRRARQTWESVIGPSARAEQRLLDAAARLANTEPGGRHSRLIDYSVMVGHLVVENDIGTWQEGAEVLMSAADGCGMIKEGREAEVRRTILDGIESALVQRAAHIAEQLESIKKARR